MSPSLTTVLAPRFTGLASPLSTDVMAFCRSARRLASNLLGSSSLGTACGDPGFDAACAFPSSSGAATAVVPNVRPSPAANTPPSNPTNGLFTAYLRLETAELTAMALGSNSDDAPVGAPE